MSTEDTIPPCKECSIKAMAQEEIVTVGHVALVALNELMGLGATINLFKGDNPGDSYITLTIRAEVYTLPVSQSFADTILQGFPSYKTLGPLPPTTIQ